MKLSDTSQHDRFLFLLALFVSDSTPTTCTCSPVYFFESMTVGDLCQSGVCCSVLSKDNTYHNGILTCHWQLLWRYVCLLWGYDEFPKRDSLSQAGSLSPIHSNSKQVLSMYSVHMGNVTILNMVDFWLYCQWTLLSHIAIHKGNGILSWAPQTACDATTNI